MKNTTTFILVALVFIGGIFIFKKSNSGTENKTQNTIPSGNVSVENGVQFVEIRAKGGYLPRTSFAKAGLPTVLRFNTESTFDCSSAMRIPSLNISKNLPISGITEVELPYSGVGSLKGSCGMGMYPFEVVFID